MAHEIIISKELSISQQQVSTTIALLDEGATIPFISRYRKEMTGSLDEVQIMQIRDRVQQLRDLDKRKDAILKSIQDQGKLNTALEQAIRTAETMAILEDIYLPYKPKRRTRASMARDKGLQELADHILSQEATDIDSLAERFVDPEKGVNTVDEALAGARDIIAETMAEDAEVRALSRTIFLQQGSFVSRVIPGKEEAALKYKDYYEWSESLKNAPSHRVLAMRRGEKEELLYLDIQVDEELILPKIAQRFIRGNSAASKQVQVALADGFKRLLKPSMETEIRVITRQKADEEAIKVFTENIRQLLLAAPLGQKRLLAIDPGFRTGCKTVCLDEQGTLLENTAIFPHTGAGNAAEAARTVRYLVEKYAIQAIAIGNGTAGRETEDFIKNLKLSQVTIVMVNESGASIYSASETAREEFPDQDITVRGAVSIGRRLMDPLAELVKIDPKSIGVGQYQHDVDQQKLQTALDDTVISCVNAVGVELNTASKQILAYVSGLGPSLAQQIITYRNANGPFSTRKELKKVPRLGDKAFEQAAGFLRIRHAKNPLDASAVHPERYALVEQMAKDLQVEVIDLLKDASLREAIPLKNYISDTVGLPTLTDIISELAKPGLDPREQFEAFSFTEGVNSITDLRIGMQLPGIVTNITNFGAFVDIGVHQDGLVHLSQLSNRFISDPNEVVKVSQKVQVTVTEVDEKRSRIALSMKTTDKAGTKSTSSQPTSARSQTTTNRNAQATTNRRPQQTQEEPQGDLASKLAALQHKFK
ncbi:RNA-binding transcriptional accessory protein [Sphingobacteriaceae bacterium WQ 2009]|uniref:RNA-binding transcriptional accessory protein n=1 Tax=Rhinopithecimicrobium faecis TaxID=2820698 RepID=A0A8T4HEU0_9SPHI|nr:RNA-binding transcriptional accessory protein [Sphingobacteriaceae bacterium WQ 2009]